MAEITSRERYIHAINHREPDRVPIDAGQDLHNGIHEVAYKNLLAHLGEKDEIRLYDYMQHLAVVKESILNRLHVDTRYIFAGGASNFELKFEEDGSWTDEWGICRKTVGFYDESYKHPLSECTDKKVKNYRIPDPKDPGRFKGLHEKAKHLYNSTGYALIGGSPASLFYLSSELMGFQEYMEKILTDRNMIEAVVDKVLEFFIEFFDGYLDAAGEFLEVVWMGDDWGTQQGPIMNPADFREIFIPRYKELTALIKQKCSVKIALHSCGSVYWAIPDFIDAGIDILHPLQGDAAGMEDSKKIKSEFGKDLVFYSQFRNQSTLPHGTIAEVEKEVQEKIAILAPGGGYVLSGGHNIQADVPPENIIALYDAAHKFGSYPISV